MWSFSKSSGFLLAVMSGSIVAYVGHRGSLCTVIKCIHLVPSSAMPLSKHAMQVLACNQLKSQPVSAGCQLPQLQTGLNN